jgi:hypothetical protein
MFFSRGKSGLILTGNQVRKYCYLRRRNHLRKAGKNVSVSFLQLSKTCASF